MVVSWESIGAIAELLGALAVIASLLYLATQVRQSNRMAKAQSYQARSDATRELMFRMAEDDYLRIERKLLDANWPDDLSAISQLDPMEKAKFTRLEDARKFHLDNVFFQYEQGLVDQETWDSLFVDLIEAAIPRWKAIDKPKLRPSFEKELVRIEKNVYRKST